MVKLPDGTVTLLFTDVARSTELVKKLQDSYEHELAIHRGLLRSVFAEYGGVEVDTQGDAFFVAFDRARLAVEAAAAAQRELVNHDWPDGVAVAVRVGMHTGEPFRSEHGYTGLAVNRAARICTMGHGGQVLLSGATAGVVDDVEIGDVALRDLGEYLLKDFDRPERLFQLIISGLASDFPPLRAINQQPPLSGTVTIVLTEGRRMMRLVKELPHEHFETLINEYHRLVSQALVTAGGRGVETAGDSVAAGFATAREALLGAVAAQRALATHQWPYVEGDRDECRSPFLGGGNRARRPCDPTLRGTLRRGRRRPDFPLPGHCQPPRRRTSRNYPDPRPRATRNATDPRSDTRLRGRLLSVGLDGRSFAAPAGSIGRFTSDAQPARHSGVAPLEASSGRVQRHRLDRGGNRQLNAALYRIAITQARYTLQRAPTSNANAAKARADAKRSAASNDCSSASSSTHSKRAPP